VAKCIKVLDGAREKPEGVGFSDLCALAECYGWVFARQRGSHWMFKRAGNPRLMNFQETTNGRAKPYQVRQLLDAIDGLADEEEE
jgi:hypothetical protein